MKARRTSYAVSQADSDEDVLHVRELFLEYAAWLPFDLSFQDFDRELAGLPGELYSPPTGQLLLARESDGIAGCVAVCMLAPGICEMKRLFVRPRFRGKGVGRHLAKAAIDRARQMDYECMRLDTVESMTEATALYRSLGFKDIEPYRYNPIPGAIFLELPL